MNNFNTIGVDLAKNVIQVSVVSKNNKELQNKELTRKKFAEFLAKQKPSLVAFEACTTAHYWSRVAVRHGHEAKIIPAKAITPFRQGHKTDKNDALAVAETAKRPNIKVAPRKEIEQQEIKFYVKENNQCCRLTEMEGVGPISAILLYATLGTGEAFKNGRELSAYIGLTPKQYRSGGKANIIGISKYVANRRLRAVLIQGARAYVYKKKEPKSTKDKWLWSLSDD